MGVPFSHEVHQALTHIDTITPLIQTTIQTTNQQITSLTPLIKLALWTLIYASIIVPVLIGALLIAVVALLITINPDLVEGRRRLVTPVLRACTEMQKDIKSDNHQLQTTK